MGNRRVKGTWADAMSRVRLALAALGSPTASKGGNLAVASGSYGSKVQRAYQHIAFLNREIAEFLRGEPYQAVIDPSPELHQVWPGALFNEHWFLRFHVLREPPAHWGRIIGECLYDFRSALDHAATILAGAEADTKTEFPIFWERAKYWARERSGQAARRSGLQNVDGMSHRVQAFIEHVQPHHRRNRDIATHPLWLLQDLTNQDKHQSPNLIGGAVVKCDLYVFGVPFKSFWFQTFE